MHIFTLIPIAGILLIVLCCALMLMGRSAYRVRLVGSVIGARFVIPFTWAVQEKPQYWPFWMTDSTHETQTDAEYALGVLLAKQRSVASRQVTKLEPETTKA